MSAPDLTEEVRRQQQADREHYLEHCVPYVRERAVGELEGVYGGGPVWQLHRESFSTLGLFAAILLQVASPGVAAGVAQKSNFRNNAYQRARGTYTTGVMMAFGTLDQALSAARRVFNMHAAVHGWIEEDEPNPPDPMTRYRANDPELLQWVQATVSWGAVNAYELLVRPLAAEEKEAYWRSVHLHFVMFGVPPERLPRSWAEFEEYVHAKLAELESDVIEAALGIKHNLFNVLLRYLPCEHTLTAGLLPPAFREVYGFRWDRREVRKFERIVGALRRARKWGPRGVCFLPAFHQAKLRVGRGSKTGRVMNAVVRRVHVPFSLQA